MFIDHETMRQHSARFYKEYLPYRLQSDWIHVFDGIALTNRKLGYAVFMRIEGFNPAQATYTISCLREHGMDVFEVDTVSLESIKMVTRAILAIRKNRVGEKIKFRQKQPVGKAA